MLRAVYENPRPGGHGRAGLLADAALRNRQWQGHERRSPSPESEAASPSITRRAKVWIQETALSTALNTSYMASQISLFGIVVGIALLLAGLGCGILAVGGALRNRDSALAHLQTHGSTTGASHATA